MKEDNRTQKKRNKKSLPLPLLIGAALAINLCFFSMWYIKNPFSFSSLFKVFGLTPGNQVNLSDDFSGVSVSFLYVGQGDCIFINDGESKVLIDTGGFSAYSDIERFLYSGGIEELDYLIITHPHSDHVGSAATLLRHFRVKHILIDYFDESLVPTSSSYSTFLYDIEKSRNDIPVSVPEVEQIIPLDNGELEVISRGGYSDLNNSSMVLQYSYGNVSFLLAGDIEKEAEEDLIGKDLFTECNVLKAAHHGSSNGTSESLLKVLNPDYVVVSCGLDNEFGFPKESFINRISGCGAKLLRTDINGNITFLLNGYSIIDVFTESSGPAGNTAGNEKDRHV